MTESGPVGGGDRAAAMEATFKLHPRPRPVTRFHRRRLMLLAGIVAALVFAAMLAALHQPRMDRTQPRELYQIGRNAIAEGIAGLPKDYGQIRQATPQPAIDNEAAEPAQAAVQSQQSGAGRAETGE